MRSLYHWKFTSSLISTSSRTTTCPPSRNHPSLCTSPNRAAPLPTTRLRTPFRPATTHARNRVFCRWGSLPRIFARQATWIFPFPPSCCSSSDPRTPFHQPKRSSRNLPSCCSKSSPRKPIRQAMWISLCPVLSPDSAPYIKDQIPLVRRVVGPPLDAKSMLYILKPLSSIAGTIIFCVNSLAMSLIIFPLALVDIPIGMDESSPTVGPIIDPVALVERIVLPNLLSLAISHAVSKLPDIPNSITHIDGSLWDKMCFVILVKIKWSQSTCNFLGSVIIEILGLQVVVVVGVEN